MTSDRRKDEADESSATASATPPSGSGELPRLGPSPGPPPDGRKGWVEEDAGSRTGWVEAPGGKSEWVRKPRSEEGWVDSGEAGSSQETVDLDAETIADDPGSLTCAAAKKRLGDFELERKIGQGGMGEVWLARQVSLDRPVAVKVLPRSLANQENFIERFQREAKAAASLVHANVLQIYSFGVSDGTPYFAMEYVEGEDLQQRMRSSDGLAWDEIARIMIGVGGALAAAHEKGLIHRDVKPSNVMLDRAGMVKVMDFGLAKATTGGNKSLTSAGLIMGTPNYLSPEQGRGDPLDGRSDLYSLGVVLYELLTGQLPFRADTPAGLIFKHVYEPPPPPLELNPDAPQFLVEIALKLLEKDPDDRYATAKEFLADLTEFLDNLEHYIGGGTRRPNSGYLDQQRVENSLHHASAALAKPAAPRKPGPAERNAPTEALSRPNRLRDSSETHTVEPPRERERERQRAVEDKPRVTSSRRQPGGARPAPPPRSKGPWVVLLLFVLLIVGGAAGVAHQRPDLVPPEVRDFLSRHGVPLGPVIEPVPPRPGTETATEAGTEPPVVVDEPEIPSGEPVVYTLPASTLPLGVTAALEAPGMRYELRPTEEGRYKAGEYTLELNKTGYKPQRLPVKLVKGDDGRGVLIDDTGRDAVRVTPHWEAIRELQDAYRAARSARGQGDLKLARDELNKAARYDAEYRPDEAEPTVAELLMDVETAIQSAERTDAGIQAQLELAREAMEARRWRAARELLAKVLPQLPEGAQRAETESRLGRCDSEARTGETLRAAIEQEVLRGAHAAAETKLGELRQGDPENPDLSRVEQRLADARALRQAAMAPGADGDLAQAVGRLKNYVETFAPDDLEAKQRLTELTARAAEADARAKRLAALRQAAQEQKWHEARRLALEVLKENAEDADAQRIRSQADTELNRQAVVDTIKGLDEALVKGSFDDFIRLLDPDGPGYAKERKALAEIHQVKGKFLSSQHRDLQVRVDGDVAEVTGTWEFALSTLGQPATRLSYQTRTRLRRPAGGRWLVTELRVEGDPRVEKR